MATDAAKLVERIAAKRAWFQIQGWDELDTLLADVEEKLASQATEIERLRHEIAALKGSATWCR